MFLQTSMTNRRQFLERSMLGFGSAFLLPSLLGSCTDHNLPSPDTPTGIEFKPDWNDLAKDLVAKGLEAIPEVGEILGPLAKALWPTDKPDVWDQVKTQTEALVKQEIAAQVYKDVTADLQGLNNVITLYQSELDNGSLQDQKIQWISAKTAFSSALPNFRSPGNELPLLGLFAQFANLHLAILRDGVKFGESWGRAATDHQKDIQDLQNAINDYTTYTTTTYDNGRLELLKTIKVPYDKLTNQPFATLNPYDRQMTITILDYKDMWKYYDITQYPSGTKKLILNEIYSDPMGSYDQSDFENLVLALPPPTQPPTQLSLWGGSGPHSNGIQVTAVQVTYPANSGPGGVTQTPRMGAKSGGSNQGPNGDLVNLTLDNPIIGVECSYTTYYVHSFRLTKYDKTTTNTIGGGDSDPNKPTPATWTFPDRLMSSIYINGASYITGLEAAACIIFGFQHWDNPDLRKLSLRTIYVTSPKERSMADFAKAYPNLAIPANLITDELKAERRAYWAYIHERAKALK